jgi:hypothetical protein
MNRILLAALLYMVMCEAWPVDATGNYSSVDATSCGDYINARRNTDGVFYAQITFWVSGYLTAYNTLSSDTYDILGSTDHKSAMLWLENYCKENPLKNMGTGMTAFEVELFPKRYRTAKEAGR